MTKAIQNLTPPEVPAVVLGADDVAYQSDRQAAEDRAIAKYGSDAAFAGGGMPDYIKAMERDARRRGRKLNSRMTAEDLDRVLPPAGPWVAPVARDTQVIDLTQTIRVSADGTWVEQGIAVPRKVSYQKAPPYVAAAPKRKVHAQRFAPGGIPAGVDQSISIPHDCANHLGYEDVPQPRIYLEAPNDPQV